ncbi:transcriptional regulator AraC family [Lachnospiraceae bacterium CAG:215]|nr:transcriptional regulator AraC family [Lachnospiraceae bacterium CAG:215]
MSSDVIMFVQRILEQNRIRTYLCKIDQLADFNSFDFGLREKLFGNFYETKLFTNGIQKLPSHTIVHITDAFGCYYSCLRLPDQEDTILLTGPTVQGETWISYYEDFCKKNDCSKDFCRELKQYYQQLPNLSVIGGYHTLIYELGKFLFGEDLNVKNIKLDFDSYFENNSHLLINDLSSISEYGIQSVQNRIELENQLSEAIYQGNESLAIESIQSFGGITVPFRKTASPTALQYRLVGLNAILRKKAEHASVPLIYVNKTSNQILNQIEHVTTEEDCINLLFELIHSYCDLVNQHSLRSYSTLIRDIIFYANSHLHTDLSLNTLSDQFNVTKNYLCTLFKKEVGTTLTQYITKLRIHYAMELLSDTDLPISEVALMAGFNETNYFIRKFKQFTSLSPTLYRKNIKKFFSKN